MTEKEQKIASLETLNDNDSYILISEDCCSVSGTHKECVTSIVTALAGNEDFRDIVTDAFKMLCEVAKTWAENNNEQ